MIFYLSSGDNQPTVATTIEEVVEMLAEDEDVEDLIEVSYTGDGGTLAVPMALTELDGGRGPASINTSAQVQTYLNEHEDIGPRITVNGGDGRPLKARVVMAFSGGGANPQVTTTASSLVTLLDGHGAAQQLVEATGTGSTPLQPMPRTKLNRYGKPPITSTLSQVVAAIQAHQQAAPEPLLTATAVSGSNANAEMQAMPRTYLSSSTGRTSYQWTSQDRLAGVTMPDGTHYDYTYDYRARRVGIHREGVNQLARDTAVVFSGGLSVAEYEGVPDFTLSPEQPTVHYVRGPDMGGGVGGMLYSVRGSTVKYSLSNGRGDIIAQSDASATITWTASYEAYGKRPAETGENLDKQRANSKDEDPTGLLNEGFRYRDIETGMWLSRDPAGFVDGPNLYAYVKQNPWTAFDPEGLAGLGVNPILTVDHDGNGPLTHAGKVLAKFIGGYIAGSNPRSQIQYQIYINPKASENQIQESANRQIEVNQSLEALAAVPNKPGRIPPSEPPTTTGRGTLEKGQASTEMMPTPYQQAQGSSKRSQYMGKTPGKNSSTGQMVIERMTQEGKIRSTEGKVEVKQHDGTWVPIEKTDMSHLKDAVKGWNEGLYKTGPKSPEVKEFQNNPDNYELESSSANRARGGATKDRYREPETSEPVK